MQRLPIEPISQASANQRKGRCGRVADGICIRLYSQEDFESRPEFTDPEIQRTSLASVILQMAAARLGDVREFPFVDPPDPRAITDGVQLLEELNAVDGDQLTETGRQMARLPVDPRIARMVIESGRQGCAREMLVIAAALSIQDPRERPTDNQQAADTAHRRFAQPESDFLAFVALWDYLAEQQRELSGSAFRRLCRAEFLNYLRVREWQDLHGQLSALSRELGIDTKSSSAERKLRVHTALLAGLLSQVGMKMVLAPARPGAPRPGRGAERGRRPLPEYLGARGTRFAVFPGSGLARKPPDWLVAAELVETSRLWARTVAAVEPEWVEPVAAHLVKRSYSEPRWSRSAGQRGRAGEGHPVRDPDHRRPDGAAAADRPGAGARAVHPPRPGRGRLADPAPLLPRQRQADRGGRAPSSSGPGAAAWSRGRTRCTRSTTPGSRPTWSPPATSTPGGRRPATRRPTCSR